MSRTQLPTQSRRQFFNLAEKRRFALASRRVVTLLGLGTASRFAPVRSQRSGVRIPSFLVRSLRSLTAGNQRFKLLRQGVVSVFQDTMQILFEDLEFRP